MPKSCLYSLIYKYLYFIIRLVKGSGTFSKWMKSSVSLLGHNWRENADMSNVKGGQFNNKLI
jgi:predicted NAD-dependent protein-ADP-ribosyltransferase YbiA (DUF1768 family)